MIVKINEGKPDERIIGEIFPEKKMFIKKVDIKKHLFKKLDAWGLDARYFTDVLLPNNYQIIIIEKSENKIYQVLAESFKKNAQYYHFKGERDHLAQIFLARRHWNLVNGLIELNWTVIRFDQCPRCKSKMSFSFATNNIEKCSNCNLEITKETYSQKMSEIVY